MGGEGSRPIWRFSQKSSNLARGGFPQDGNGDFNNDASYAAAQEWLL